MLGQTPTTEKRNNVLARIVKGEPILKSLADAAFLPPEQGKTFEINKKVYAEQLREDTFFTAFILALKRVVPT